MGHDGILMKLSVVLMVLLANVAFLAWNLFDRLTTAATNPVATDLVPAAALSATTGALIWFAKLVASGNLVHRDPVNANVEMSDLAERMVRSLERSNQIAERSMERERLLLEAWQQK